MASKKNGTSLTLGSGVDAVFAEFATPEEAARFVRALRTPEPKPRPVVSLRHRDHVADEPQTFALRPALKDATRVVFKNGHYPGFLLLWNATSAGVTSEELMNRLELPGPKSLPPTLAAWGKRARTLNLDLRELLEVDRGYSHGKPQTIYRLTPKGREVFRPETEPEDMTGREVG